MANHRQRVLVTGAGGLIGREIFTQLDRDIYKVVGVDNNSRFNQSIFSDEYISMDLAQFLDYYPNNFDIVYHMAAVNGTANFYSQPVHTLTNNINIDFKLFEWVSKYSTKLVYASSSEVVAGTSQFPTPELDDVSINNIHNPRWSYRLAKMASENYLMNSSLDFVIARFFNIWSEHSGEGHFIRDIVDKIKNNNFTLRSPHETRSFCYVRDAVQALFHIKHLNNRVVNIGSDEELTVLEAANCISDCLAVTPTWQFAPSLSGSVARRIPDLSVLKSYYPLYKPVSFQQAFSEVKHLL